MVCMVHNSRKKQQKDCSDKRDVFLKIASLFWFSVFDKREGNRCFALQQIAARDKPQGRFPSAVKRTVLPAEQRVFQLSFVNKIISSTLQSRIVHKSFNVTVLIGLLCFNLSIRLRLIPYCVINLYVDMFFSFNVL